MTDENLPPTVRDESSIPPRFRPLRLHVDCRDGLLIEWADGRTDRFSLMFLRKRCPCAGCRGSHGSLQDRPPTALLNVLPPNIDRASELASAKLVGNYALQITWADGHNTGIYDFRYLRKLGDESP